MSSGGFDVIIGNPPYIVYSPKKVSYTVPEQLFQTYNSKNLYSYVYERSLGLGKPEARVGLIVQGTVLSAERLDSFQNVLLNRGGLYAIPFPRRPESIFEGVEMPVAIILSFKSSDRVFITSRVSRFYTEERPTALAILHLVAHSIRRNGHRVAKIGVSLEKSLYSKLEGQKMTLEALTINSSKNLMYYQEACRYWVKCSVGMPFFKRNGKGINPPHGRTLTFISEDAACFAACIANSSLFYWFYSGFSDCEHVNDTLVRGFPIPEGWEKDDWTGLYGKLSENLEANATAKTIRTKQGHVIEYKEMKALLSKRYIDEIDRVLAKYYGFTDEELDFIINYDIKYRMGASDTEDDDGA